MHVPPDGSVVLVRYGDISTKSDRVRRMMEDKLVANLAVGLERAGLEATVEREWTRPIIVTTPEQVEEATAVAASTIGVVSASPARRVDTRREAVIDALVQTAERHYDGGTFAIRVRRADKALPYTSADIEREAGSAVYEAAAERFEPAVDLDDPDMTLHAEVRPEHAYVFVDRVDGPGGLPVGSQSPMVALVSGGIDSPVAAYRAMRRGSPIIPVYV
ncbi:MAG: tRNA sulfurtransferase, partial [Halobacteriota archaeon]